MAEKIGNYDFNRIEKEVLDFWEKNNIYQTLKEKNKGKKKFFFIQGPPYTSGRIHMGHAWNNSLKDIALRYKRMQGFDILHKLHARNVFATSIPQMIINNATIVIRTAFDLIFFSLGKIF